MSVRPAIVAIALLAVLSAAATASEDRPNILLIVADDIGQADCGAYNPESKIPTPNLDELARTGMRFTDAHSVATLCSPSRYSILSGNYPWRGRSAGGTWKAYKASQFLEGQQTTANLLRGKGYHTAFFGKWHLGGAYYEKGSNEFTATESEIDFARRFRRGPLDLGFDYSYLLPSGLQRAPRAFFRNDRLVVDPSTLVFESPDEPTSGRLRETVTPDATAREKDWRREEAGPRVLDDALEFIERHHARNLAEKTTTPFFIQYNSTEVHSRFVPARKIRGTEVLGHTGLGARSDLVWQLDLIVGYLLEALVQRGLLDDTLVVFTSDNGAVVLDRRSGGVALTGNKGKATEGGHRVPLIARWGDGTSEGSEIPAGSVSEQLIGLQDLAATFAELVGAKIPRDQAVDSISFLETLRGERPDDRVIRDHLLVWAQHRLVDDDRTERLVVLRQGKWKLIVDEEGRPLALYNLGETLVENDETNLVATPQERGRVSKMTRDLERLIEAPRTDRSGKTG